jgi:hypothetical protein
MAIYSQKGTGIILPGFSQHKINKKTDAQFPVFWENFLLANINESPSCCYPPMINKEL